MNRTAATYFARFAVKAGIIGGALVWAGSVTESPSWSVAFTGLAVLVSGYLLFDEVHPMSDTA